MYTCSREPLLYQLPIHNTNFYQCGESFRPLSCGEYFPNLIEYGQLVQINLLQRGAYESSGEPKIFPT